MKKIHLFTGISMMSTICSWQPAQAMEVEERLENVGYDKSRKMFYVGREMAKSHPQFAPLPMMEDDSSVMYGLRESEKVVETPHQKVKAHSLPIDSIGTVLRETVLGEFDRRILVEDPHEHPWRVHGHMIMDYGGGSKYIGSGTLIGEQYVITAGHNLYDRDSGPIPTKITFYPGMRQTKVPYSSEADRIIFHPQYKDSSNNNFKDVDMGVIRLKKPLGKDIGYFGVKVLSNTQLDELKLNVTGYPGDYANGTLMCTMEGPIKHLTSERLYYDIDTAPGQSGSGVWVSEDGDHGVVAVHAYGNDEGRNLNSGTRLNSTKANLVQQWVQSLETVTTD